MEEVEGIDEEVEFIDEEVEFKVSNTREGREG